MTSLIIEKSQEYFQSLPKGSFFKLNLKIAEVCVHTKKECGLITDVFKEHWIDAVKKLVSHNNGKTVEKYLQVWNR